MKTLTFLLIIALMASFNVSAAIDDTKDSTEVAGATGPVIVCTIDKTFNRSYATDMEMETVTCSCYEVFKAPEIKEIVSNPVYKTITVTGAEQGDQIYILNSKGEILLHVEAEIDNPKIDISKLTAGTYTIGVQAY
ncbi:MAG: hypothetical protein RB294_02345 [Bacteroidales bacterium]|nr:hypothetical protein [Bacteroidales bacterium]